MTLTGKGFYIWQVPQCEQGDPDRIAALAQEVNLSHVLVKVADATFPYNVDLDHGFDYARPVVKKLQMRNIQAWGWQYVYGDHPDQEAEIAVKRALELGLNGFVVNAEDEYQNLSKAPAASRYMNILRNNLGTMPIALSSYRYPSYHIHFPWVNFLDRCDYNMPQVYWVKSHDNAGEQLKRCVNEFQNLKPFRPIVPTGPTFKWDGWIPYEPELVEFMEVAKKLGLTAVNFWNWDTCRKYMRTFWDLVRDYTYEDIRVENSLPAKYLDALNARDIDAVMALYTQNAVHIRAGKATQGKKAIRSWITSLLEKYPDVNFNLVGITQKKNIYNFRWEATQFNDQILTGQDTIGSLDDKITYHYSFFSQTES